MIKRAKQNAEISISYKAIPIERLTVGFLSDAAFANATEHRTQGAQLVGFTAVDLNEGLDTVWTPAEWKSYRLPRVVGSTLAGEAQPSRQHRVQQNGFAP